MTDRETLITVGKIINTQGIKGEVRVWPLTDYPERFKDGSTVLLESQGEKRVLTIERARNHKNFLVIKFTEIKDMNSAEMLKEGLLKIPREELMELPEDTYYIFEITGMEVVTTEGLLLGKVKNVIQTGSNDIYVVSGTEKEFLIPAVRDIVKKVDRENRLIIIQPIDGLLDL